MNNIVQGTGGAITTTTIAPSARPSIHNHQGCIFAKGERMVSYGFNHNQENGDSVEQGVDVVDNVPSKFAHPIRAPRPINGGRRKSLETQNKSTDYDDTAVLSKSVPATLPSRLYYSESDDEQEASNENRFSDVSYQSISTPNRSNVSRNTSYQSYQRLEPLQRRELLEIENKQNFLKIPIYLVGVIVAVYAVVASNGFNIGRMANINSPTYDQFKFNTDTSSIGEKYNVDEFSILQVQTGISTIFEKQDTGSFMFVYNSDVDDFNQSEFNEFINDISLAASKYLRNDSTPRHYTTIEGTKLDMKEHSELLCRYRGELEGSGVLLVRHLEAVPADLAMAFHYYCDEYNPLVRKTAIFFTLNVATCPRGPNKKSTHALIEKCLAEKWRGIPGDNIGPLLTRIVSVVIDLTSVF